MTRQDVYDKCTEKIGTAPSGRIDIGGIAYKKSDIAWFEKPLLPREAIDAIIDCAVEEAIKAIEDKTE